MWRQITSLGKGFAWQNEIKQKRHKIVALLDMPGYLEIEIWNDMHSKVRRYFTEENDHKYIHF